MKLLIVPLVALGVVAGFALGRWSVASSETPSKSAVAPPAPPPAAAAPDPRDAELATLRDRSSRQAEELKSLQKQLDERPVAAKAPDAPAADAVSEELWGLVKNFGKKRGRGEDQMKAMKLIGQLKPEHAAYFIARYREANAEDPRHMALMCAAMAGGPDASNLLAGLLSEASLGDDARNGVLQALAGGHGMPNRLVLTDSLSQLGDRMLTSTQEMERAAAAGILAMRPRDGRIEQTLRNLAETETSDQVRGAAYMALARGGSAETLAWLKAQRERLASAPNGMGTWQLEQAIAELEED